MKITLNRSGLYFVFEGKKYEELYHLISSLNERILESNIIDFKIEWFWDFRGNDLIDTMDGKVLDIYYFDIALIQYSKGG